MSSPPVATLAEAAAAPPGTERDAADRLSRVHGAGELHATLLALLLTPNSKRSVRAWQVETTTVPHAGALRAHAITLSGAARLPWFDRLLARMGRHPLVARQGLLHATRRIMAARGMIRPLDRLHWLAMRRALGEVPVLAARDEARVDADEWPESDLRCIAAYSAFLSRMVPDGSTDGPLGRPWYEKVMATWRPGAAGPPWRPPHAEEMLDALAAMQTLSWRQRPVIVRTWVTTAVAMSPPQRLSDLAADALRLTCTLLDSPQPPELARHYISLPAEAAR